MIHWNSPHNFLFLLLVIPVAIVLYIDLRRRKTALASFMDSAASERCYPPACRNRDRLKKRLRLLAVSLILLAFARPQWGFHWRKLSTQGLDIMIVLDASRSMLAQDLKPNRLQQAKWGVRDLVHMLRGDRVGLVVFSGSSFLQCPLTSDYSAFLMTLEDVYCGIIPRGGTAISSAIRTALDAFANSPANSDRVIILLTDGEDHEGDPLSLIPQLKRKGVRLYAIGIGTPEGDLIPITDNNGRPAFLKDTSGHVVKTTLHEQAIERLALETGGAYVRAAPGNLGLEHIFTTEISHLKRGKMESRMVKVYHDRYQWPLSLAIILLFIEASLPRIDAKEGTFTA